MQLHWMELLEDTRVAHAWDLRDCKVSMNSNSLDTLMAPRGLYLTPPIHRPNPRLLRNIFELSSASARAATTP